MPINISFTGIGFKPVHHLLADNTGKAEIVSRLLEHTERTRQLDRLLELAKEANPLQYTRYEPYGYDHTTASSPYPGMHYFDVGDSDRFFGRELLTAKLVGYLHKQPFLAVIGASGSGKSSVVRAGVVPALQCGQPLTDGSLPPEGCSRWPIHIITPTTHPLEALAASLTREAESVTATATLMDDMGRDSRSFHLYVRKLLTPSPTLPLSGGGRLLLVVDQFEELFTLCRNEAERRAFIDNLLTAVDPETAGPTLVVITLRADFYAHCAQYEHLRESLACYQEYIGPMSAEELRRAIELPAQQIGCEFEAGLVDLILRDVGDEPGALPLLSHALLETWRRRAGRTMTLAGYAESGGVRGAIAKTAASVFERLSPEQQTVARRIFLRLTELGEGTQDTRRRACLTELNPRPGEEASTEPVLKVLADARLVTTDEEAVEVAHEALIREWPTLRQWLNDNREGLRLHRRLNEAAQEWQRLQRDPGGLYRGAKLAQASEWAEQYPTELNGVEWEFLTASKQAEENERLRELEQARALAEAERRRAEAEQQRAEEQKRAAARLRKQALLATTIGVIALVAAVAAGFLGWRANENAKLAAAREAEAKQQADVATAHRLAAEGRLLFEEKPLLGLRLAMEGWALSRRFDQYDQIDQFIREMMQQGRLLTLGQGSVEAIYASDKNPSTFIVDRMNAPGELRGSVNGQVIASLSGPVNDVTFSPDEVGAYIIVHYDGGTPGELRRSVDGQVIATLSDSIFTETFSPDESASYFVINYRDDIPGELRRTADGTVVAVLSGPLFDVFFSSGETASYFVVKYRDNIPGELRRSDEGSLIATLSDSVSSVTFPDEAGTYFKVSYDSPLVELRRSADGTVLLSDSHINEFYLDKFSPNGTYFIAGYHDNTPDEVRRTDDNSVVATLSGPTGFSSVSFSTNGVHFIVNYDDQTHSELRRTMDGSVIHLSGLNSSMAFSWDKAATYFFVDYNDDTPDELRRTSDGSLIATLFGSISNVTFSRDMTADYFVVNYRGNIPGELRRSINGALVETLTGPVNYVYFFSSEEAKNYFVVTYNNNYPGELRRINDGQVVPLSGSVTDQTVTFSDPAATYLVVTYIPSLESELLQMQDEPLRLAKLGLGLGNHFQRGSHFDVAGVRLITWYSDGRAYLLDLAWLRAMGGKAEEMPVEELVRIACEGPFASGLFDEAELKPYLGEREPQACK